MDRSGDLVTLLHGIRRNEILDGSRIVIQRLDRVFTRLVIGDVCLLDRIVDVLELLRLRSLFGSPLIIQ